MVWVTYKRLDRRGQWNTVETFGSVSRFEHANAAFVEIEGLGDFFIYWNVHPDADIAQGFVHETDSDMLILLKEARRGVDHFEMMGYNARQPTVLILQGTITPMRLFPSPRAP